VKKTIDIIRKLLNFVKSIWITKTVLSAYSANSLEKYVKSHPNQSLRLSI